MTLRLAYGVLSVRQLEMFLHPIIKCLSYATFLGTSYLVVCSFTLFDTV
jgi:hypothetical protein